MTLRLVHKQTNRVTLAVMVINCTIFTRNAYDIVLYALQDINAVYETGRVVNETCKYMMYISTTSLRICDCDINKARCNQYTLYT